MPAQPPFTLHIEKYGCIDKMSLPIGGIHALIGPNDSGKSTVLRAARTLLQFAAGTFSGAGSNAEPFDPFPGQGVKESALRADVGGYTYVLRGNSHKVKEGLYGGEKDDEFDRSFNSPGLLSRPGADRHFVARLLRPASLVRISPDALRRPSELIPDDRAVRFDSEFGDGLGGVYDRIANRDIENFVTIQNDVRSKFRDVKNVQMANVQRGQKAIEIELTDGTRVPAAAMSEGLLYYLAFAALQYLERPSVLLVEEPENGLHPARVTEVVALLREYSERTPVLMATHSAFVVNELTGDEVSVLTRKPGEGPQRRLLKDTPNFEERSRVYALGELWVSYADGKEESPLFEENTEPDDPGEPVDLTGSES